MAYTDELVKAGMWKGQADAVNAGPVATATLAATATTAVAVTGLTATVAELNQAADISANIETVVTTNVITEAETGKTFFLSLAGGFATTLPAVATSAGVRLSFIVKTAPTTAYTIAAAAATPIHGMVMTKDVNAATDTSGTNGTGVLTITLVANKAMIGDRVDLICDGALWYALAYTSGNFDAITFS